MIVKHAEDSSSLIYDFECLSARCQVFQCEAKLPKEFSLHAYLAFQKEHAELLARIGTEAREPWPENTQPQSHQRRMSPAVASSLRRIELCGSHSTKK